jgi:hypothetical protein
MVIILLLEKNILKNEFLIWLLTPKSIGVDLYRITYQTSNHRKK